MKHRERKVHRRMTPWETREVPEASLHFAEERIDYLEGVAFDKPLRYLLACAYLQGINDCVEAHIRNPAVLMSALEGVVWA